MMVTDQQLLPVALSLLHHRVKLAGEASRQAVALHDNHGPQALRAMLQDYMQRGGSTDFVRSVADALHQYGRPDIAAIHAETADGW